MNKKTLPLVIFLIVSAIFVNHVEAVTPLFESSTTPEKEKKTPLYESSTSPEKEKKALPAEEEYQLVPNYVGDVKPEPQTRATFTTQQALVANPNLIPNPDLENEGSGGVPASWHKGGYGTNTRTLTYPAAGSSGNGITVAVTSYTNGDAKWFFDNVPIEGGATYRFTDKYKSNASSIVTVEYVLSNGSKSYKDIALPSASSAFANVTADFTAPSNAVSLTIFHLLKSTGTLTTDEYSLVKLDDTPPPNNDNFVPNGSLESGTTNPTSWLRGKWGNNTAVFTYPVTGSGSNRAAQITLSNYVTGDAKWFHNPLALPAGTYTYSDDYKASVSTFITVQIKHSNGSVTYQDIAQPAAASNFTSSFANFTVPATATGVTVFHLINKNGSLTIDNVSITKAGSSGPPGIFTTGAVSIRLDDNWISQYQNAFPILDNAGIDGTLYVVSQQISDNGFPGYMSRAQIEEVFDRGHEIGAHTRTHRDLATLSQSDQVSEIQGSRNDILAWDTGAIRSFSYPFGSYTANTIQIVEDAGFESAGTSNGGLVTVDSDIYQLERRGLENTTTFAQAKQWIDQVKAEKKWLILVVHDVRATCADRYCIATPLFQQIITYLDSTGIPVLTVSEALDTLN